MTAENCRHQQPDPPKPCWLPGSRTGAPELGISWVSKTGIILEPGISEHVKTTCMCPAKKSKFNTLTNTWSF